MEISFIDGLIIIVYFVVSVGIGLWMSRRAKDTTDDFFLSGRKLPWYIAGTSMVATTFAADTPLAVTELVAQKGIAGNWLWWNMLFGGMLTVFFFARMWRRANILTDAEFVSIRYSGVAARFLRGWRAVYIGVAMNVIVMAWVNLAMVKITKVVFPDFQLLGFETFSFLGLEISSHLALVSIILVIVVAYSSLAGLTGTSITDAFQFIMAMIGSIALAIFAIQEVGGISGLKDGLSSTKWVFEFMPSFNNAHQESESGVLQMSLVAIVAYLGVQWWASWYPGAEPGGGGYVAQRMMSAKDEKHSLLATLWFQVAHFAVRPWPWILVALATLVLYPHAKDKGATYVMMIRDYLPPGLSGLLLAAFLAAYMSTMASQIVWGTSYIINDLYRPFINTKADEKSYVRVSRLTTIGLMLLSTIATTQFDRISDAWKLILTLGAGIGLVLILRWFWWRVNAWSEIAAMIAPYAIFPLLTYGFGLDVLNSDFETGLLIIVGWSTVVWLVVTLLTKPTEFSQLEKFYRLVHPGGIGWRKIASQFPEVNRDKGYGRLFASWILGCILVICSLFGIGKIIFTEYLTAVIYLVIAFGAAYGIYINFEKMGWKEMK